MEKVYFFQKSRKDRFNVGVSCCCCICKHNYMFSIDFIFGFVAFLTKKIHYVVFFCYKEKKERQKKLMKNIYTLLYKQEPLLVFFFLKIDSVPWKLIDFLLIQLFLWRQLTNDYDLIFIFKWSISLHVL